MENENLEAPDISWGRDEVTITNLKQELIGIGKETFVVTLIELGFFALTGGFASYSVWSWLFYRVLCSEFLKRFCSNLLISLKELFWDSSKNTTNAVMA